MIEDLTDDEKLAVVEGYANLAKRLAMCLVVSLAFNLIQVLP